MSHCLRLPGSSYAQRLPQHIRRRQQPEDSTIPAPTAITGNPSIIR
jgi:hypothetical protein